MKRPRPVLFATLAMTTLAFGPPAERRFAWPWFMLIRGPGLSAPVLLSRSSSAMSGDVITIYSSLKAAGVSSSFSSRPYYEVAEFWGPNWIPLPNGKPPMDASFERGDTFAKIYRGNGTHQPVWVGRSQGRDRVPLAITDSGRVVLERAGLKLR